ncbi:MAG: hypothetical protein AUK19_03630 [Candidatus Moranbacteria bacterium CG2_30_45_14]|nr:MAG: hypothetical protein AUK19_03630 [Candidatus Moranbacteria bacterium CG2_30_45_14]
MIFIFMNGKINAMTQKSLPISFLLLFIASTLFLFWQSDRELNPDQGKNWWTLSFVLPKQTESLSFNLENHSNQTAFSYEISVGREIISKETFTAKRGERTTVLPPSIKEQSERVKITVSTGTEKKEIYR